MSYQTGKLYGIAKTHRLDNSAEITVDNLKFCFIIGQSAKYTYKVAQVIASYLRPLGGTNEYIIQNIQEIAKIIRKQDPLKSNEEYVSYDVKPLFANVPVPETIEYIINKI